jgi:hypothetical protein
MYSKTDSKFDNFSNVFIKLNDEDQNIIMTAARELLHTHQRIKANHVEPAQQNQNQDPHTALPKRRI